MASALPAVPLLLGPSNLDHWSDVLQTLFHYEDLDSFVFEEPSPEVEDAYRWYPKDFRAILFFKASLEKVRPWLLAAGWKPHMQSAQYHYGFIMSQVPMMDSAAEEAQDDGEKTGDNVTQNQMMPSFRHTHKPFAATCRPGTNCWSTAPFLSYGFCFSLSPPPPQPFNLLLRHRRNPLAEQGARRIRDRIPGEELDCLREVLGHADRRHWQCYGILKGAPQASKSLAGSAKLGDLRGLSDIEGIHINTATLEVQRYFYVVGFLCFLFLHLLARALPTSHPSACRYPTPTVYPRVGRSTLQGANILESPPSPLRGCFVSLLLSTLPIPPLSLSFYAACPPIRGFKPPLGLGPECSKQLTREVSHVFRTGRILYIT